MPLASFRSLLIVALILTARSASAQEVIKKPLSAANAAAVDKAIQEEMEKQQVVGMAVGIIQEGQIVYLKGYGQADRDKQTPVTTATVFNWASNSKPLTAVAAMQLVDMKQLDLDADVRKFVPEFPDKGSTITVRHLLCHQSGIPHYLNGKIVPTVRDYPNAQPFMDPIVALDRFNNSPLLFKPGDKTDYSSYAYILLSAVVQRAGKDPFEKQIQDRIAKPLGMKSLALDVESKNQQNAAIGYIKNKEEKVVPAPVVVHYWKHGAGGFQSNIGDFTHWAEALINRTLVSEAAEKTMWTKQKTSGGSDTTFGLGFVIEDQRGLKVSHNGLQDKATTRMVIDPRGKDGVVIMTNCRFANVGDISTAVYTALNGK